MQTLNTIGQTGRPPRVKCKSSQCRKGQVQAWIFKIKITLAMSVQHGRLNAEYQG